MTVINATFDMSSLLVRILRTEAMMHIIMSKQAKIISQLEQRPTNEVETEILNEVNQKIRELVREYETKFPEVYKDVDIRHYVISCLPLLRERTSRGKGLQLLRVQCKSNAQRLLQQTQRRET